jgi:hypothetical protein
MDPPTIHKQVAAHYGSLARSGAPADSDAIAKAFGYSEQDLSAIPSDANLGVSCGNPLAIATLREASPPSLPCSRVYAIGELIRSRRVRRWSTLAAARGSMCFLPRRRSGWAAVLLEST